MKDYLRDIDGKVRLCESNIAKMNIFECMYYFKNMMIKDLLRFMENIKEILPDLLSFIILPIIYPYMAYQRIKEAKKTVKRYNDDKNN